MKAQNRHSVGMGATDQSSGTWAAFVGLIVRELRVSVRNRQDLLNPLLFYLITVSLFPLGVSPDIDFLRDAGAGILWVAALLATLMSLDRLFRQDFEDGTLEQMMLQPHPLFVLVLGKVIAHWIVTGIPLVLLTPVLSLMLFQPADTVATLCLTLLLGTPILMLVGAIGAALTLGLKNGGILLSLLVVPLYIPVLVFGTGTVAAQLIGTPIASYFAILGAMLALAFTLAPFAITAALRISMANS